MNREGFRSQRLASSKLKSYKRRSYAPSTVEKSDDYKEMLRGQISEEARDKVRAMKQFFYGHYVDWFKFLNQRAARLEQVKRESRMTPGQQGMTRRLQHFKKESKFLRQRRRKLRLGQFNVLALLGKGAFGAVFLARQRDSGEVVALKKMRKEGIDAINKQRIMREKKVLVAASRSCWLVGLRCSFQDKDSLYLAMEYVPGGDLRALLSNVGVLDEPMAKFYLTEMVMAIGALHQLGYTHRDLKPDNFMVAGNGHIKLGDFGLSKQGLELQYKTLATFRGAGLTMGSLNDELDYKTKLNTYQQSFQEGKVSVVGSPDYMAVEVLRGVNYNFAVDWWSLGVIFYEMCSGLPPFYSTDPMEIFSNIMDFKRTLQYPELYAEDDEEYDEDEALSEEAWMFIQRLIEEPALRLGKDGVEQVKHHSYFRGVDWENLLHEEPPFVPDLDSDTDSSYFAGELDRGVSAIEMEQAVESKRAESHDPNKLIGFTFVNYK